jgi:hypothetical protein
VVAVLSDAVADGRLTLAEHAGRVQRAYTARTLGELATLTQDLLPSSEQPLRLDESRSVAAFFTTQRRSGRWIVPGRLAVTAVGGQVVLDLREAVLADLHTVLHTTLIGGQLTVVVPAGVNVVVTQLKAPTGRAAPGAAPPRPGTPLIEVRAFTVGGRVRVQAPRRQGRWRGRFTRGDR